MTTEQKDKAELRLERRNVEIDSINQEITHLRGRLQTLYKMRAGRMRYDIEGNMTALWCTNCGKHTVEKGYDTCQPCLEVA